jgi:hypothetical protein
MDDIDTIPSRLHDIDTQPASLPQERPQTAARMGLVLVLLGVVALAWFVLRR